MRSIRGVRRGRDGAALVAILASYWTTVFPVARRELVRWRALAATIPDGRQRTLALGTLDDESGLAEGAAIFATLVPSRSARHQLVRLLVAWQVMYDYLDTLGEQRPGSSHADLYAVLATALARNNVDLITIRDFYGHASLSTTNRYLHSKLDATAVAAMNAAHGIEP